MGGVSSTKLGKVATAGRRAYKEQNDVSRAKEDVAKYEEDVKELEDALKEHLESLEDVYMLDNYPIDTKNIKPNKRDINIDLCAIVWRSAALISASWLDSFASLLYKAGNLPDHTLQNRNLLKKRTESSWGAYSLISFHFYFLHVLQNPLFAKEEKATISAPSSFKMFATSIA